MFIWSPIFVYQCTSVVRRVALCCPGVLSCRHTTPPAKKRMLQQGSLARHATRHPCSIYAAARRSSAGTSRLHSLRQAGPQRQYLLPLRRSPSTTRTHVATPSTASETKKDEIVGPSTNISVIYARLQRVSILGVLIASVLCGGMSSCS